MSTKFAMTRDINGYNGFGLKFADDKYSVTLGAATEATMTVPSNAKRWLAVFSYESGVNIWTALNETAAVPAGGTIATTTSERNPTAREVGAGDVIHVITATASIDVGVTLYVLE